MKNKATAANSPCTAVLVDDDLTSRWLLRGVLKRLGFTLLAEATNGDEGVSAVSRTKPDIVLLDVCMPFQTGPGALPAIIAAHPAAKVVMLTSMADEATVRDCIQKGAAEYLRKDTPVEELCRVLTGLRQKIAARRGLEVSCA
ncbi:MAG TPA: response regulator transcription factor [Candidatus Paceibacterota bacterium]|nr:response regulator transcription factor [Verrucomicrobiota bacterium]HSA11145.1 response regulator transcription factor [Candidatus Paceibacterota bacterium]